MSPDLFCQLQLAADGGGGEGGAVQRQQSLLDLHQQAVVGVEDPGGHLQYSTVSVQYSTSTGEPWTGGYLKEGLELVRAVRRHSVQGLPQLAEGGLQLGLGEHLGGKYYHFQQKIF